MDRYQPWTSTRKDHKGDLPAPRSHPGSGIVPEEFRVEDCTECVGRVGIKFLVCKGSHRQWWIVSGSAWHGLWQLRYRWWCCCGSPCGGKDWFRRSKCGCNSWYYWGRTPWEWLWAVKVIQDDILMLKVEASQEGEWYLEQKEIEKARQLLEQEHDTKKPASQPAKRKVFGDDDDSINTSDHHTENNDPDNEKTMTTMNTMTTTTWTMTMTLVNCQPVDLQDKECHRHRPLAVVRIRKWNVPEWMERMIWIPKLKL